MRQLFRNIELFYLRMESFTDTCRERWHGPSAADRGSIINHRVRKTSIPCLESRGLLVLSPCKQDFMTKRLLRMIIDFQNHRWHFFLSIYYNTNYTTQNEINKVNYPFIEILRPFFIFSLIFHRSEYFCCIVAY